MNTEQTLLDLVHTLSPGDQQKILALAQYVRAQPGEVKNCGRVAEVCGQTSASI